MPSLAPPAAACCSPFPPFLAHNCSPIITIQTPAAATNAFNFLVSLALNSPFTSSPCLCSSACLSANTPIVSNPTISLRATCARNAFRFSHAANSTSSYPDPAPGASFITSRTAGLRRSSGTDHSLPSVRKIQSSFSTTSSDGADGSGCVLRDSRRVSSFSWPGEGWDRSRAAVVSFACGSGLGGSHLIFRALWRIVYQRSQRRDSVSGFLSVVIVS